MTDRIGHKTLWTFVITSIALVMVTLDNLVVTTALPVIRHDLHATLQGLEWTVNAYTLTFAVLLLTGAALGDRFGRRRLFVLGLGIFTAASAFAALAPSIDALNLARALQGVGGAIVMPLTLTLLSAAVPAERRARARCVGRDRRARDRARPARRGRGCPGHLLAMDLLAQRPDRAPPDPARVAPPRGEPRLQFEARPPGARPRERRPARHRVGARTRERSRLGQPGDPRLAARRRPPRRDLRPLGAAHRHSDAPDGVLPQPDVLAGERRLAVHVLRDVRLDLPAKEGLVCTKFMLHFVTLLPTSRCLNEQRRWAEAVYSCAIRPSVSSLSSGNGAHSVRTCDGVLVGV
jgi:hypothetical protein